MRGKEPTNQHEVQSCSLIAQGREMLAYMCLPLRSTIEPLMHGIRCIHMR